MKYRPYDPIKDYDAAHRIWLECRWLEADEEEDARFMDIFLAGCDAIVADIDGEAECMVSSAEGRIRHLVTDLPLGIIATVNTSLIARRQGMASRLTAAMVAQQALSGQVVSALGMFDEGYYSRLGFGTGPYEHFVAFDPTQLKVSARARVPVRLSCDDYAAIHGAMMNRWRGHGSVQVLPVGHLHGSMGWIEEPLGLGFRDDEGALTHFVWGSAKGENGPYKIEALAYQNREQLLELLAVLKGIGDQIHLVEMIEPLHIQLQDFIDQPFRRQNTTEGSKFAEHNSAEAFWQIRINDVQACLAKTHLKTAATLEFNLELSDPIEKYLADDIAWRGAAGDYVVSLGARSEACAGKRDGLPTLRASVGGFSRLWLGCASANAIAMTGEIDAPESLLQDLEQVLSLPLPKAGWEY